MTTTDVLAAASLHRPAEIIPWPDIKAGDQVLYAGGLQTVKAAAFDEDNPDMFLVLFEGRLTGACSVSAAWMTAVVRPEPASGRMAHLLARDRLHKANIAWLAQGRGWTGGSR